MRSEKAQKYKECVVCEREHIPPEYLPLGDLHDSDPTVHRYLVKQCEAGNVRRFRLGRLLFVHADHMASARRRFEERQAEPIQTATKNTADDLGELKEGVLEGVLACTAFIHHHLQVERPGIFDCLNDAASSLDEIKKVLERLTAAVESIATQPSEEMHTINGNPAPWNET
jgi:hypothetical protein